MRKEASTDHLRAASYARVSTTEQAEKGTSLATQAEECRSFITRQGWVLVAEYVDEGVSGTTVSRPALDALLKATDERVVDVVVVTKIDRVARSMTHLSAIVGALDDVGVRLATVDGRLDTTTSHGRLMRNILGSFAEFERDVIVERTTAGLRKVAEDGYWPGGPPPFGWRSYRAADVGHTKLSIVDDEAAILREIVRLISDERLTTRQVATELNARGVKPRRASRWHYSMLYHLLDRSPLSGKWEYASSQGRGDAASPVAVPVPPIITAAEHERLRANLSRNRAAPRPSYREHFYLLCRRLYGPCGGRFHGVYRRDRDVRQYRCSNSVPDALERCQCHRIPSEPVEAMVWNAVIAATADADLLVAAACTNAKNREQQLERRTQASAIERQVAHVETAMVTTATTYAKAGLPGSVLGAALAELDAERSSLVHQLAQFNEKRGDCTSSPEVLDALREVATAMQEMGKVERHIAVRARVLALFDTQVRVVRWRPCVRCRGAGRLPGGRGGIRCDACFGARRIALTEVQLAVAPVRVLADLRRELGWPTATPNCHSRQRLDTSERVSLAVTAASAGDHRMMS